MTVLILHENGKRPKEPNAQQGGEGRGLSPQPEEEAHTELHETTPPSRAQIQNCSAT